MLIDVVTVSNDFPGPVLRGQPRLGDTMNEALGLQTVRDHLSNGDESEVVFLRELLELGATGARSILVQDLANHTSRGETGESSEVHRGLGVTNPLQHTAVARAQRRNVARTAKIRRLRVWIDGDADCPGAVLRADTRRYAEPLVGIDADGESSAVLVGADFVLRSELQLIGPFIGQREAD